VSSSAEAPKVLDRARTAGCKDGSVQPCTSRRRRWRIRWRKMAWATFVDKLAVGSRQTVGGKVSASSTESVRGWTFRLSNGKVDCAISWSTADSARCGPRPWSVASRIEQFEPTPHHGSTCIKRAETFLIDHDGDGSTHHLNRKAHIHYRCGPSHHLFV
jgi:hypothetical protein